MSMDVAAVASAATGDSSRACGLLWLVRTPAQLIPPRRCTAPHLPPHSTAATPPNCTRRLATHHPASLTIHLHHPLLHPSCAVRVASCWRGVSRSPPPLSLSRVSASVLPPVFVMSDKYRRVDRPHPSTPMLPNEIRITSQGMRKAYISYAIQKLTTVPHTLAQPTHTTPKPPPSPAPHPFRPTPTPHPPLHPPLSVPPPSLPGRPSRHLCAPARHGFCHDRLHHVCGDRQAPRARPAPAHVHRRGGAEGRVGAARRGAEGGGGGATRADRGGAADEGGGGGEGEGGGGVPAAHTGE